jgi:YegS/Rv2252/BmrU family lipid kinase
LTYRKTFLIFNPYAGALRNGRRERLLNRSLEALRDSGIDAEAVPTTGPGTASTIARQCIDAGADLILVAGGDGTINEVVNGMVSSRVPLGILPAGTANVLAMELAVGKRLEKVARALPGCIPERVAAGRITNQMAPNGRSFLLMAGVGLDAHIVYGLSPAMKASLGKAAYWAGGFSQLGRRFPEFDVEVDGIRRRASFALVARVRNYGGDLEIAPRISLFEDEFEIVLFSGQSSFVYLKYMYGVVTRQLDGMRGVTIVRARRVLCTSPEDDAIHAQVDGEYAGRLPLEIEIQPDALTLLVPPGFRQRRPVRIEHPAWTTSPTR